MVELGSGGGVSSGDGNCSVEGGNGGEDVAGGVEHIGPRGIGGASCCLGQVIVNTRKDKGNLDEGKCSIRVVESDIWAPWQSIIVVSDNNGSDGCCAASHTRLLHSLRVDGVGGKNSGSKVSGG